MNINQRADFIKSVSEFKEIKDDMDKFFNKLYELGINIYDSEIFNQYGRLCGFTNTTICQLFDINEDAMGWFIYENNWGLNKRECRRDKNQTDIIIDSIEAFYDFEKGL